VFPDPAKVPATGIPAQLDWFVAPPQVIAAFAGTGTLVPTASPAPAPTTGGAAPAADHSSGGDAGGSTWLWVVGGVAVVALGGFALGRRTSRARNR
jgi:MYXO-CTERM domain-containing protein